MFLPQVSSNCFFTNNSRFSLKFSLLSSDTVDKSKKPTMSSHVISPKPRNPVDSAISKKTPTFA